ncbi:MAG: Integral membrane protein, partial [uncultured Friedmanniella sp.]
ERAARGGDGGPDADRPRGGAGARALAGPVGGVLGAADRRAAHPGGAALGADVHPQRVDDPRPALARPGLPAGEHRLRLRPGAAGALPAEPHRPARRRPDRLRPAAPAVRPRRGSRPRRGDRHPGAGALPRGARPRPQHRRPGLGAGRGLVDGSRAGPLGLPERRAGGGRDGRLPLHPVPPAGLAAVGRAAAQRRDPRLLPPLPGVRRVRRQPGDGAAARTGLPALATRRPARRRAHPAGRRGLRGLRAGRPAGGLAV